MSTNNTYEIRKLSELVEFAIGGDWGKDPSYDSEEYLPVKVIRGTEFARWNEEKADSAALRKIKKTSLERRRLMPGDLVIEISGGGPNQPVGRAVLIDEQLLSKSDLPLVCSNFFRLVRLTQDVVPRYVKLALDYQYLSGEVSKYQTSSTNLRNLNFNDYLNQIELPIYEKEVQEQIADQTEKLLDLGSFSLQKIQKSRKLLSKFRQSILSAAVSGRLTDEWRSENKVQYGSSQQRILSEFTKKELPEELLTDFNQDWNSYELRDLVIEGGIFDGPFGSNLKTSDYTKSGVRVVRLENIGYLEFIASKETYVSEAKYKSLLRHEVFEGDLIVSSFVSDGIRTTLLPSLDTKAIAKADCFCVRTNKEVLLPEYLAFILSSPQMSRLLSMHIHGATRPRINTSQLKNTIIPVPTLPEQIEIIRRIRTYLDIAKTIEQNIVTSSKKTEKLTQSILARAFGGELTN